jgi:hypothetical protein
LYIELCLYEKGKAQDFEAVIEKHPYPGTHQIMLVKQLIGKARPFLSPSAMGTIEKVWRGQVHSVKDLMSFGIEITAKERVKIN